ncbi:MAG: hypothetical protein ACUVRV_07720 [Cyanobacteriota bacterium]
MIDIALETLVYLAVHYGHLKNQYFEIEKLVLDMFCNPEFGLELAPEEAEKSEAVQLIRTAKELAT